MPGNHERALDALLRRGRLRTLETAHGIDFTSNDYLGLAQSRELGAGGRAGDRARRAGRRRWLASTARQSRQSTRRLEQEAARFFGGETALFFGGGFIANSALLSTLPSRGDLIVYDEFIHASAHDGMRLSKANAVAVRHNDAQAFEDAITAWRRDGGTGSRGSSSKAFTAWTATARRSANSSRSRGVTRRCSSSTKRTRPASSVREGRGLAADLEGNDNVISLHTCGKALGVMGALVIGPRVIRDFLVNRGRPFIYATAPSPLIAATVRAALEICRTQPERREASA